MIEYIDIVDEDGNPTGQTASREEVHEKGLLHNHVHVWIVNSKGEVLLQKRVTSKKTYPNMWAMAFEGHVSAGKTIVETVIAEGEEELDIKLFEKELKPLFGYERRVEFNPTTIENSINNVFVLKKDIQIEEIVIQEDEITDVKWMKLEDYKKEINDKNPAYRAYAEEFPKLFEYIEKEQS